MTKEEEAFQKIIEQHEYVPKHERATEKEVEALLTTLGIKKYNLPKIRKSDPAVKGMKFKRGDVVRITRDSIVAGSAIYYRVVL